MGLAKLGMMEMTKLEIVKTEKDIYFCTNEDECVCTKTNVNLSVGEILRTFFMQL